MRIVSLANQVQVFSFGLLLPRLVDNLWRHVLLMNDDFSDMVYVLNGIINWYF
jgi:hypothetical protein